MKPAQSQAQPLALVCNNKIVGLVHHFGAGPAIIADRAVPDPEDPGERIWPNKMDCILVDDDDAIQWASKSQREWELIGVDGGIPVFTQSKQSRVGYPAPRAMSRDELFDSIVMLVQRYERENNSQVIVGAYLILSEIEDESDLIYEYSGDDFKPRPDLSVVNDTVEFKASVDKIHEYLDAKSQQMNGDK